MLGLDTIRCRSSPSLRFPGGSGTDADGTEEAVRQEIGGCRTAVQHLETSVFRGIFLGVLGRDGKIFGASGSTLLGAIWASFFPIFNIGKRINLRFDVCTSQLVVVVFAVGLAAQFGSLWLRKKSQFCCVGICTSIGQPCIWQVLRIRWIRNNVKSHISQSTQKVLSTVPIIISIILCGILCGYGIVLCGPWQPRHNTRRQTSDALECLQDAWSPTKRWGTMTLVFNKAEQIAQCLPWKEISWIYGRPNCENMI